MKVLVTRPAEDAAGTVRRLAEMGHEALTAPVLEIRFSPAGSIDGESFQAWLATSRNGVRALVHNDVARSVPLLAVGRSTAELARQSGFLDVHDADGDVDDLIDLAARLLQPSAGPVFHAAGKDVAGDLLGGLENRGFSVIRRVLYRAEPVDALPASAREAIVARQIDAALFFSARSAEVFATLATADASLALELRRITAICISRRAADALPAFRDVKVAARPNQDALLAALDGVSFSTG